MAAKTAAKSKDQEVVDEPVAEEEEAPPAIAEEAAPPSAKRSIGAKEPIIFKWKLLGTSDGVILTLFKAVEREEIDAHLERVAKEGLYNDLRIVDIGEKVVQTKSAIPVLHKAVVKTTAPAKAAKKAKLLASKKPKPSKTVRVSVGPPKKKPVAVKKTKKAPPTAKKKKRK